MVCECSIIGLKIQKTNAPTQTQKSRCSLISCRVAVGIAKNKKDKCNICKHRRSQLIRSYFAF